MNDQSVRLSNTILYSERWEESVDFYRRVLELPVVTEKDWFVEFRLTDSAFVSVARASRASIDSSKGQGITIALCVDDVAAVRDRLAAAGAEPGPVKRHPWGAFSFFCRDPEGYRLEFWQPLEE